MMMLYLSNGEELGNVKVTVNFVKYFYIRRMYKVRSAFLQSYLISLIVPEILQCKAKMIINKTIFSGAGRVSDWLPLPGIFPTQCCADPPASPTRSRTPQPP